MDFEFSIGKRQRHKTKGAGLKAKGARLKGSLRSLEDKGRGEIYSRARKTKDCKQYFAFQLPDFPLTAGITKR